MPKNLGIMIPRGRSIWQKHEERQPERKEIVEYCITHNRDYKGTVVLMGQKNMLLGKTVGDEMDWNGPGTVKKK